MILQLWYKNGRNSNSFLSVIITIILLLCLLTNGTIKTVANHTDCSSQLQEAKAYHEQHHDIYITHCMINSFEYILKSKKAYCINKHGRSTVYTLLQYISAFRKETNSSLLCIRDHTVYIIKKHSEPSTVIEDLSSDTTLLRNLKQLIVDLIYNYDSIRECVDRL